MGKTIYHTEQYPFSETMFVLKTAEGCSMFEAIMKFITDEQRLVPCGNKSSQQM